MQSLHGRTKGFTFLQMLITLTLIFALTLFSIPPMNIFLANGRLKRAAEDLYFNLQLVRSEAIKKSSNLYVILSPGSVWCYGVHTTSSCDCAVAQSCVLNGVEKSVSSTDYRNIIMAVTGITGNVIQFEGNRAAVSGTGSVNFSNAYNTLNVEVNALGRIRICSNTMQGYSTC